MKMNLKNKFFVFNPKSYLTGKELLELAKKADELAVTNPNVSIFVTGPYADLKRMSQVTKNIIVTSQHLDGIEKGRGMGAVLADSLVQAGVKATFLNHAERPLTLAQLIQSIEKAKELELVTIVCADSLKEAKAIAMLSPDIILCEPTELIGTGKTSDSDYIQSTNSAIKNLNSKILVMQAAGISTPEDVYRTIKLGADGTGCTSGIVKADSPIQMLEDMVTSVSKALSEEE